MQTPWINDILDYVFDLVGFPEHEVFSSNSINYDFKKSVLNLHLALRSRAQAEEDSYMLHAVSQCSSKGRSRANDTFGSVPVPGGIGCIISSGPTFTSGSQVRGPGGGRQEGAARRVSALQQIYIHEELSKKKVHSVHFETLACAAGALLALGC